jgi:hypothetical protein
LEISLPAAVRPLLDAYLESLKPLQAHFYGMYLYGSIALGAFEELQSDIDIVALTRGEWSSLELKQLAELHARLIKTYPLGRRLEVFYVPVELLGSMHPNRRHSKEVRFPVAHDGTFSPASHGEMNAVTWWIIQHKGIRLMWPERSELPLEVTWQDVLNTMRYNLDVYFAGKAKRPYIYLYDAGVEFAVTNLCRILTTIEEGEIVSKSEALARWRGRLPERWVQLLDEAWRIRYQLRQTAFYRSRVKRMRETLAFIGYVRERVGKKNERLYC